MINHFNMSSTIHTFTQPSRLLSVLLRHRTHLIYFSFLLIFTLVTTLPAYAGNQSTRSKNVQPIAVFVRQCNYSAASASKGRPHGFSKEKCMYNLLDSIKGEDGISLVFFLDTFYPMDKTHFIYNQHEYPVIEFKGGTESASFLYMVDYVVEQNLDPDTIIYFLEDDYLHLPNWPSVLREAFTLTRVDYVTLYDHRDKYQSTYSGLKSEIFHTTTCHWRTTPSTTNTYAMLFSTLERDLDIHKYFSLSTSITRDHAKFCELTKMGSTLISSIPGYSSHLEPAYLSPCTDWEKMLQSIKIPRQ